MRFLPQRTDHRKQPELAARLERFAKGEFAHPLALQRALLDLDEDLTVSLVNGAVHVSNAKGSLLRIDPVR